MGSTPAIFRITMVAGTQPNDANVTEFFYLIGRDAVVILTRFSVTETLVCTPGRRNKLRRISHGKHRTKQNRTRATTTLPTILRT